MRENKKFTNSATFCWLFFLMPAGMIAYFVGNEIRYCFSDWWMAKQMFIPTICLSFVQAIIAFYWLGKALGWDRRKP